MWQDILALISIEVLFAGRQGTPTGVNPAVAGGASRRRRADW
jgi:hypothetical protein